MNDLDPHDFWLRQVLDDCQSTLIKLQSKYGKDELTLEEIDPNDYLFGKEVFDDQLKQIYNNEDVNSIFLII